MESTTHVIHGDVCNYRHALTKCRRRGGNCNTRVQKYTKYKSWSARGL